MKLTNALVVKLVDTKDLKSLPFMECQFESGRGHQLLCIISIFNTAFTNLGIIKKYEDMVQQPEDTFFDIIKFICNKNNLEIYTQNGYLIKKMLLEFHLRDLDI